MIPLETAHQRVEATPSRQILCLDLKPSLTSLSNLKPLFISQRFQFPKCTTQSSYIYFKNFEFFRLHAKTSVPMGMLIQNLNFNFILFTLANQSTEKDIVQFASQDSYGLELLEEDLALRKYSLNFAQGDKSPLDCVQFYKSPNFEEAGYIDSKQVSLITPSVFQEHVMRLFVKDARKVGMAEQAFTRFAREVLGIEDIKRRKEQSGVKMSQQVVNVGGKW